jgi:hypothetical protein
MAFRLYIVPAIVHPQLNTRFPKHFTAISDWAGMDYGHNPTFLVAADLTPAQDTALVANADVFGFPFNLDTGISGGAITSVRNIHEAFLIPAQVIPATYRLMARYDAGLFQFMGRLAAVIAARTGTNEVVIDTAAKLNVQFGTLPVENQGDVLEAASQLGYDTSFIVSTTQIRAILKVFGDAWGNESFRLNTFIF